jgi:hypothetical protein
VSSSIFNSEYVRAAHRLPAGQKVWVAVVVTAHLAVLYLCLMALRPVTERRNFMTMAVTALRDRPADTVAFGASHVQNSINPQWMTTRHINLSANACDYVCAEGIAAGNADALASVKAVVLEVDTVPLDYDTVVVYGGDYRNLFDLRCDLAAMRIGLAQKVRLFERYVVQEGYLGPAFAPHKFAPAAVYDRLRGADGEGEPDVVEQTAFSSSRGSILQEVDGRVVVGRHSKTISQTPPRHIGANRDAARRLVHRWRAAGLPVILVRLPHHASYWAAAPPEWETQVQSLVAELKAEGDGPPVVFWDFGRSPPFPDSEFFNGDHLNVDGAKHFTALFDARLRDFLGQSPSLGVRGRESGVRSQ